MPSKNIKVSLIFSRKNYLFILFTTLFSIGINAQNNKLIVKSGQTLKLNTDTSVNVLIMEDNSTIDVSSLKKWRLEVNTMRIGKNCKIIGKGKDGVDRKGKARKGADGPSDCEPGKKGNDGQHGGDGQNGTDIHINAEITALGTLTIDVRGGTGGDGQKGGTGGTGGKADISSDCRGAIGGKGGTGGNAGIGGDGGDVTFEYANIGQTPNFTTSTPSSKKNTFNTIFILNDKGDDGAIGKPGDGGPGGASRGNRLIKKGGGSQGPAGESGEIIGSSSNGTFTPLLVEKKDCLLDENEDNYALIISISKTDNGNGDNPFFEEDAKTLASVLKSDYDFEDVFQLTNPTKRELETQLATIQNLGGGTERLMIYISGHGTYFTNSKKHPSLDTKDNYLFPFHQIFDYIKEAPIEKVFFILDACHSGKIFDVRSGVLDAYIPNKARLIEPKEVCGTKALTVIATGFDDEKVPARGFTLQLIKWLKKMKKSSFTAERLFYEIFADQGFKTQKPIFGKSKNLMDGDFIFFKKD